MTEDFFNGMDRLESVADGSRSAETLARLLEVSQALSTILELDELLTQIMAHAVEIVGAERGFLMLLDDAGQLDVRAVHEMSGVEAAVVEREVSQTIIQEVIQTQQALRVVDAVADARFADRSSVIELNLRSVLCAPLMAQGAVIGVIYLDHRGRVGAFSEADLDRLRIFGNLAAVAIQNARLFEAERRRSHELATTNRIGQALASTLDLPAICRIAHREISKLVDCPNFGLFEYDEGSQTLSALYLIGDGEALDTRGLPSIPLEPETGPQSRAIVSRRPVIVADIQAERDRMKTYQDLPTANRRLARAVLTIPLIAGEKVVGTLQMQSYQAGIYTEEDAQLLSGIASQVALAMQNARLFGQAERRVQYLAALRTIDTAITASLDVRVILNVILEQVTTQLGIHAADVLLFDPHARLLEFAAGRGFRTAALRHTHLRLGEGHAGRAALERRIVSIDNLAEAENGLKRAPLLCAENFVAYFGIPLVAKGQVKGVLEIFHRTPLDPDQEWLGFLEAMATQAAIAIDNAELFSDLQRSALEITLAYDRTLEGWSKAMELRDRETEGHTLRVVEMTLRLARAMGMSEAELVHVRRGALLHDIGKMAIPDQILHKPGRLTEDERAMMEQHPVYAYEMLSPIAFLRPALDIPYCHHEKWDGTGYPQGLQGEQIPLAARVFAVVDVWDALNSDRPYRKAWPADKAREYIRRQAGKHFDPQVVETFLELL